VETRACCHARQSGVSRAIGVEAVICMRIEVADAIRRVGAAFEFELCEQVGPQTYGGRELVFCEPICVRGSYVYDAKTFCVTASVTTALASNCALCGRAFVEPLAFSLSERFVKDGGEDDETYPYAGEELLLDKAVFDNLYLQLPIASVCRADCKGLCPICGADRNETACGCETM